MSRARQFCMVLLCGAVAAGSSWAAAEDGTMTTSDGGNAESSVSTAAVANVQPDISANFSLFRTQAPTGMPENAAVQVGSPKGFGRNAELARAIDTATGTGWVIPGNGYLCIAVPDPVDGYGTTCAPTDVAIRQGLAISLWGNLPDGKVADTLLVPDGVAAVLDGGDGSQTPQEADAGVVSRMTERPGALHLAR